MEYLKTIRDQSETYKRLKIRQVWYSWVNLELKYDFLQTWREMLHHFGLDEVSSFKELKRNVGLGPTELKLLCEAYQICWPCYKRASKMNVSDIEDILANSLFTDGNVL